ncbi:MAG TPA: ComE operon protein 2 [Pseudogracilibacillus sp.]|nr:ComE operon protein 2 [Pseudogracilibacillus sp.]
MDRISWEQYFMAQAHVAALRSTCTRLMVGAIIVRENRIISSGYNGSVADGDHCIDNGCYLVDGHCVRTVHAEANAVLQCAKFGVPTNDTVLYVTHFPCLQCTKQLIQAGISKIYYEKNYRNHELAIQLLEESHVETEQVTLTDVSVQLDPSLERDDV